MTWYEDLDGDNLGNALISKDSCAMPVGYVSNDRDLNDNDAIYNFFISINEPTLSEYRVGDELPISIRYSSQGGSDLGSLGYEIRRTDTGEVLKSRTSGPPDPSSSFLLVSSYDITENELNGDVNVGLELEAFSVSDQNTGRIILIHEFLVVQ